MILFDEPMIGLDPHAIKELKEMMKELRADGCSLLVSTHMIESIDMLWDQTLIMKSGKILAQVQREELEAAGQSLEELFFALTENEEGDTTENEEKDNAESEEEDA